jgi:lysozyme family protein
MEEHKMIKDEIIKKVIFVEGGYANDDFDAGGETKYGVTASKAREHGYIEPMKELPLYLAIDIYERDFWHKIRGDEVITLSDLVAYELFDTAVHCGVKKSVEFLQRSLNVLNRNGVLYNDIVVDGLIGQRTLMALKKFLEKRNKAVLLEVMNCLQGSYYVDITEKRKKNERFIYGWLKKRVLL